ncbi:thermonuclease family protein [Hymenobacter duratus]|uniref:thermonuclease family protein n=1 Tax=Hymenobacter duratus TaxID=2771356 RepID=UPI001CC23A33
MKDKALYFSGWLLLIATGFGLGEAAVKSLLPASRATTAPAEEAGRVVRVVDADTYDVLAGGTTYRVRLAGVDAPEPDQPFGPQSADSVARLLNSNRTVLLTRRGMDLYGRTLAMVWLPVAGKPALALDSLLVVRGWAWAWDPKRRVAGRAAQQAAAVAARRGRRCGRNAAGQRFCPWPAGPPG